MTLTERAEVLLGDVQPELSDDPIVQMAMQAIANELDRLEDAAIALRDGFFPTTAVDPALSLYERGFDLPVAPPGQTIEARRALVAAHFRKRIAGSGLDWEMALTQAMGTTEYAYSEGPGPYQITIRYGFSPGAPTAAAVRAFAREITPAHIEVLASYSQGFLVGISLIGDPL